MYLRQGMKAIIVFIKQETPMRIFIMPVVGLLLTLIFGINADQVQIKTLQGLRTLNVIIEQGDYEKAGLSRDFIKTSIELKLRMAKLTVDPAASEAMYFKCQIFDVSPGLLWYHIEMQILQPASLKRNPDLFTFGSTWSVPFYGMVRKTAAKDKLTGLLTDMMNRFLGDYLAANQ